MLGFFFKHKESFLLALSHFLFSYLMQVETYVVFRHQTDDLGTIFLFLLRQPFIQFEHILFSLVCWFLFAVLLSPKNLIASAIAILIWFLSCLYLVVDQLAFPFFGDHLQISLLEGRIHALSMIRDSFFAEMNLIFFCNILILLIALAFVIMATFKRRTQAEPSSKRKKYITAAGLVFYLPFH